MSYPHRSRAAATTCSNQPTATVAAPARMMGDEARPALLLQPELYRIRDAASVLGVSERMVYSLIEAGVLTATYLPGTGTRKAPVRIARADLLAFIEHYRGARR